MRLLPFRNDYGASYAMAELVEEAEARVARRLSRRERLVESLAAAGFLGSAIAMLAFLPSLRPFSVPLAATFVLAYALAARVKFDLGAGYLVPTEPIFVAMLFLLPATSVPWLVAAALLLAEVPDYLARRTHPERAVLALGDSWHALGPALVLTVAGVSEPAWSHWPIYLVALLSRFALDLASISVREWLALGIDPRTQLAERGQLYAVDAMMAPIGLLAAIAGQGQPYAFLLCLPLAGAMKVFANERRVRIQHSLELSHTYRGTAMLLGDVVEADDAYTGSHSRGVVSLALKVGRQMGLEGQQMRNLEFAALLHDVGKIAVPKEIVNKPGPLEESEWEVMRAHTVQGQRMLERVGGMLAGVGQIVRSCHERWDGKGYPDGLAGEQIPIEARIVYACDAFNAMTTTRPYRRGMTAAYALNELRTCAGGQFDPRVAKEVVRVVERELESGQLPINPRKLAA